MDARRKILLAVTGTAMAVAVLIGLIVGTQVDDRLGSPFPIFAILGSLIGLASGAYSFARVAQYMNRPKGD